MNSIAVVMATFTYLVSLLPLSAYILLPLQIAVGAGVTIILCEYLQRPEYLELKSMAMSVLRKIKKK